MIPVLGAVEVVDHEKTALEQIFAQTFCFSIGEGPVLYLYRVDPRIIEDVIIVEGDYLLRRTAVNAGEAVHRDEKLAVGLGVIARPGTPAAASVAAESAEALHA